MLELNKWFFVLLLNFLALLFILNIILFKPLLRLFLERENSTKGQLDAARDMDIKREEALSRMNRELLEAREKAKALYEKMTGEGMRMQQELLEEANREAQGFVEKAKTELRQETEKARKELRADVGKFSDDIVGKLIGI